MLRRAAKDEGLTGNLPLVLVSADGNDDAYERYGWRFNSGQSDVAVVILPKGWARPRDVYRLADQEAMLLEHVRALPREDGSPALGAGLDAPLLGAFGRAFLAGDLAHAPRSAPAVPANASAARALNAAELAALDPASHVALLVAPSGACAGNALCGGLAAAWDALAADYGEKVRAKAAIATFDVDVNDAPRHFNLDALPAIFYLPPNRHQTPQQLPPRAAAAETFRRNFDALAEAIAAEAAEAEL